MRPLVQRSGSSTVSRLFLGFIMYKRVPWAALAGLFFIGILALSGCINPELEKAFEGGYPSAKNNHIVIDYCQSCHNHKDFDATAHIDTVRANYKRKYFRRARECRSCHFIEKQLIQNQFTRKTRMPQDANRGLYRKFEKNELSKGRQS